MGKKFRNLVSGMLALGAVAIPIKAVGGLNMDVEQTWTTNGVDVVSNLRIENQSGSVGSPGGDFYQQNISANLAWRGCTDIHNGWTEWKYGTVNENMSKMFKEDGVGHPIYPGTADTFNYTIPTNQVVGWQTVQAGMVAPAGTVPFDYIVPITPTTTTDNGTTIDVLQRAGFNTDNTMAYFENSSVQNSDSDSMTDVEEWVAGTDRFVADGLEGVLNVVSNGVEVSTSPAVAERVYDVSFKTNLMDSAWMPAGSYTNNAGETDGFLLDTNNTDRAFYKAKVSLP